MEGKVLRGREVKGEGEVEEKVLRGNGGRRGKNWGEERLRRDLRRDGGGKP